MDDQFMRDADRLIKRLRDEAKLTPLRLLLKRLLVTIEPMNLGDWPDQRVEDVAMKDAFEHLSRLGCLAVLSHRPDDQTVSFELFSKRGLAYLAEKIDAALRSHDRS